MQDAIGVVDPLEIVTHLGAERAAGEGMRWVAVQLPGGTVGTSTIQLHVSGQSCPHAPRTIGIEPVALIER